MKEHTRQLTLTVNGEPYVARGATLTRLLEELGLPEASVVAEINGVIVPPEDHARTALHSGDNIELIHFVGGG